METNSPPLKPLARSSFKSINSELEKIIGNF